MPDSLGDRMKRYESVPRHKLISRMPVIIRVDGKAFHTLTEHMKRPFDEQFMDCMRYTALYLAENIQGCKLAYVQSDEISLLLTDYDTFTTQGWFDNDLNKMISISAAMATAAFNVAYRASFGSLEAHSELPVFDSRAWNLPKEEVCNYFIWRQQDATRNSVQMLGRHYFSHTRLLNRSCAEIQDMLFLQHGVNWNDIPTNQKRGSCVIKMPQLTIESLPAITKYVWGVDNAIPIFTQDREYIEKWLIPSEQRRINDTDTDSNSGSETTSSS